MYKKIVDPQADRETKKYSNPIPSREYILSLLKQRQHGMNREKISALLLLDNPVQKEALRRRLRAMCRDGQLSYSRRKEYQPTQHVTLLKGTVMANKETFGFVAPDDGSSDLFLSPYQMRQVFPNDRVLVRVIGEVRKGRREAAIVEVLKHNTERLVGYYKKDESRSLVEPTHPHIHHSIHIETDSSTGIESSTVVLVEITKQPSLSSAPEGRITKILGKKDTPGIESNVAIHMYQLPHTWSNAVTHEIDDLKHQALLDETRQRTDLRQLPFVTIDGEDSKDFDDAVYCKPQRKGWNLLVAIADVSYYVKPDTMLDKEANLRGNSVYLPHQVVSMLPEVLSNDLCSIKPNVDRLCLVCDIHLSKEGEIQSYQFYPATICSKARLTYQEVTDYLEDNNQVAFDERLFRSIRHLKMVYESLSSAKQKRGAVDINLPESQVILDTKGKLHHIQRRQRTIAHRIIEECMLAANVCAAQFLLGHKLPTLFRIHDSPPLDKLVDFKHLLSSLGIEFSASSRSAVHPKDFSRLIEQMNQHPDSQLVQLMLLRTLNQAIYSPTNKGHFGLAYPEYIHFTSPIRRYPDLLVHRAIYQALNLRKEPVALDTKQLTQLGQHCSVTERRADDATRQVISLLKCQLMQGHLGEVLTGIVTHVTGFGFFVELTNHLIEGLVHVSSMKDDHYVFDAKTMTLKGERQNTRYRVGTAVSVRVARVDVEQTTIDFELCH